MNEHGVIAAIALSPPDALWAAGDGTERLDALDAVWLDAETRGARIARSAAHAVLIVFADPTVALAWAESAWPRIDSLGFGALRGAMVAGSASARPDPVTGAEDLIGADVRRASTLADGAARGELRLDDALAGQIDDARVKRTPTGPVARLARSTPVPLALPPDVGAFVGRDRETDQLLDAVRDEPVAVILGPGGAGKTRLAVRVAWRWHARTGAPAAMAELAPARDLDGCVAIVAEALGVDISGDGGATAALGRITSALRERGPSLLVIDNAEQVLDAVRTILGASASCPELRILVTSRIRLDGFVLPLDGLPADDALALLRAAAPGSAGWTEGDLADARRLVDRLDRLPLGLALAAAQLDLLRPGQVLARISELVDPSRPARHASLAAAIVWSVTLLPPRERAVFVHLAAFRGAFGPDDADRVAGLDGPAWTTLRTLVDASLLRRDGDRFVPWEQVRETTAAWLEADPRRDEVLERHASWATREVDAWYDGKRGLQQPERLERLRRERADLLAVLARDDRTSALAACALDVLADVASPLEVQLGWLDRGVAAADRCRDDGLRARLRWLRGAARRRAGHAGARSDLDEALALATDPVLRARIQAQQAVVQVLAGNPDECLRLTDEVLRLARDAGADIVVGRALHMRARIACQRGSYDAAEETFAEAMRLLSHDDVGLGLMLLERSANQVQLHAYTEADTNIARAATAFGRVGFGRGLDYVAAARLSAALRRGDEAEAISLAQGAVDAARRRGEAARETMTLSQLAIIWLVFGHLERAEPALIEARAAAEVSGQSYNREFMDLLRGTTAIERRDPEAALRRLEAVGGQFARETRQWAAVAHALLGDPSPARSELAADPSPAMAALLGVVARPEVPVREWPTASRNLPLDVVAVRIGRSLAVPVAIRVRDDGARVVLPDGVEVDLSRRVPLRKIVAFLADRRRVAAGESSTLHQVVAAGWPEERILPQAATNRVYVAMATLRKLGLSSVLLTTDRGYLFDPAVPLETT